MAYNNYNSAYPAIPYNGYNGAQGPAYPYQQASSGAYYPTQGTPAYPYHQAPAVPPPLMPAMQGRQNNMILDWVQGPEAASAYYVEPGRGAILMDINRHTFYLTSRGEDGIPRPLQSFDYYQRQSQPETQNYTDKTDYVPRSEYNELERRIKELEEMVTGNSANPMLGKPEVPNNV